MTKTLIIATMTTNESVALPSKCKQLVMELYAKGDTDLKHGLLKEHINGLAHIVLSLATDIKYEYKEAIQDSLQNLNVPLDNKIVKQIVKEFNITNHDLEGVEGNLVRKGKYRPVTDEDESEEDLPPSYKEWLQSNGRSSMTSAGGNAFSSNPWFQSFGAMAYPFVHGIQQHQMQHPQPSSTIANTNDAESNEVITVTYEGMVVSIMIVPPLTIQSTMKDILLSESCNEVFAFDEVELVTMRLYYYKIDANQEGKKFTFHSPFLSYTVNNLNQMKGIGVPMTIHVICK